MALSSNPLLLAIVLALYFTLFSGISATTGGGHQNGGDVDKAGAWVTVDNDPHVQELAAFAVAAHNIMAQKKLVLEKVIKCETYITGVSEKLVISCREGGFTKNYEAVVWWKPWMHVKKLVSFKVYV